MMKWWINEKKKEKKKKKKRNFTPKLNEKLYLPIFAKMIRPKYFQIKFCNNTKTSEKKLPELFRYNCIPKYYCLTQVTVILSVIPTVSCSCFAKTQNKP